ncbi:hypothetical protein ALIPUT_00820 [Alistipes putredinis DSM 17216]|uniref:Uncharacterized protein n=1 Tax=Alistipes putredinis DSM 17216 TaxID=445970 RepID=B0MUP1_9BACT|nr:hypothetical protein ALIPUT_00820 [Alistipes putredinis DSM 17216]
MSCFFVSGVRDSRGGNDRRCRSKPVVAFIFVCRLRVHPVRRPSKFAGVIV